MEKITLTIEFEHQEVFNSFHLSLLNTLKILNEHPDRKLSLYWQIVILEQVFYTQERISLDIIE